MWKYTPRQIAGYLAFATNRRGHEMAETVAAVRLAMHGKNDQVKKQVKDWTKE